MEIIKLLLVDDKYLYYLRIRRNNFLLKHFFSEAVIKHLRVEVTREFVRCN